MSDHSLARTWAALRTDSRTALIPYLTAGYPTWDASLAALRSAADVSDIIEVGVPFSDPLADGPTIQRSTFEALRQGMTLPRTLALIAGGRGSSDFQPSRFFLAQCLHLREATGKFAGL